MKKIGLTQRTEFIKEYNETRDCLDQRWTLLLEQLGYVPVPLTNKSENVEKYLDSLTLDGIILTGGGPSVERDHFEEKLIKYVSQRKINTLGVCRGAQMLAKSCGLKLRSIEGHCATRHKINFGKHILEVNSYHEYALPLENFPSSLNVLASAEDKTVEAFSHSTLPQLGIMWHPEREMPFASSDLKLIKDLLG